MAADGGDLRRLPLSMRKVNLDHSVEVACQTIALSGPFTHGHWPLWARRRLRGPVPSYGDVRVKIRDDFH
jgi:hypothetical protein